MAEVPDHLAPMGGLNNFNVRLGGIEFPEGRAPVFRFDIDDGGIHISSISLSVRDGGEGLEGLLARAHGSLNDVLRQLLHRNEVLRAYYEKRSVQNSQGDS